MRKHRAELSEEDLRAFRGVYLGTAQRLKTQQEKNDDNVSPEVQELDFEFVLFASAVIDYDYIMELIARYSQQKPGKLKMSREQLIGLIQSDAKFMDERDDIAAYINTLKVGEGLRKQLFAKATNDSRRKKTPRTRCYCRQARPKHRLVASFHRRNSTTYDLRWRTTHRADGALGLGWKNAA